MCFTAKYELKLLGALPAVQQKHYLATGLWFQYLRPNEERVVNWGANIVLRVWEKEGIFVPPHTIYIDQSIQIHISFSLTHYADIQQSYVRICLC